VSITIGTIQDAVSAVVAQAISARVVFAGSPNIKPPAVPAVSSDWQSTAQSGPLQSAHYKIVAGKTVKKGTYRTHTFATWVLLSTTGDKPNEDAAQHDAAQAILDAVDADATLRGTTGADQCTLAEIVRIAPYETNFDSTNYSGLEITWSILEL